MDSYSLFKYHASYSRVITDLCELILLISVSWSWILITPFHKVEESFNTHAVHDIINLDLFKVSTQLVSEETLNNDTKWTRDSNHWDHTQFPGVVPRTFVGALVIGLLAKLMKYTSSTLSTPGLHQQMMCRAILSFVFTLSLCSLTRSIQRKYGFLTRFLFNLFLVSQFHYLYYSSRFLPNTFAAILVNLSLAYLLDGQFRKFIYYAAFAVALFRFDTILLFGCICFNLIFIQKRLTIRRTLINGIPAGVLAILISVFIDSYFWQRILWPEGDGIIFNIWHNKSHEWGTQPYLWYFYSGLPRMLLSVLPILVLCDRKTYIEFIIPTIAYVLIYSSLPHKELRFIIYTIPIFDMCAAHGVSRTLNALLATNSKEIKTQRRSSRLARKSHSVISGKEERNRHQYLGFKKFILVTAIIGIVSINICATLLFGIASYHNYPGGYSYMQLSGYPEFKSCRSGADAMGTYNSTCRAAVYVGNKAAQTGFSSFLKEKNVYYNKEPQVEPTLFQKPFHIIYLLTEPIQTKGFLKQNCDCEGFDCDTKDKKEYKCRMGQRETYCSVIHTVKEFYAFEWSSLKEVLSTDLSIISQSFVILRPAINLVRCSEKSLYDIFV